MAVSVKKLERIFLFNGVSVRANTWLTDGIRSQRDFAT